jgi:hypothetical protein
MHVQNNIILVQKLLPLVLDVAALVPGLNIPVAAVKIANDSLIVEEAAYSWFTTTGAGKEAMRRIDDIASQLGLSTILGKDRKIRIETRAEVQLDFDMGHA